MRWGDSWSSRGPVHPWVTSLSLVEEDIEGAPRRAPARRHRPALIALSGIDGSGKSSHSRVLHEKFGEAGIPTRGITARIGRYTPLRAILAWVHNRGRKGLSREKAADRRTSRRTADEHWTGWRLTLWAIATVVDYALWLQHVRWRLWQGEVVIADRYLLDFAVEFSVLLASQPRLGRLLLAVLPPVAPRPLRAYLLRIPATESLRRKPDDEHGFDHFRVCTFYDQLAGRYGVRVIDNTAPFDEVSAELVEDVFTAYEREGI